MPTRVFDDEDGIRWNGFAEETIVAHGKQGARLAFRADAGDSGEAIRTTVTFNSMPAAALALRTMSERELRRRLSLARMAAGGV